MKKIIATLAKLYLLQMLLFSLQKVVFLVVNHGYGEQLGLSDWLGVIVHGWRLDLVATCYLMWVPLLVLLVSVWTSRMPLRRVLTAWYALAGPLVVVAWLADMVLYSFWGAKLDVADLFYARNPKEMLASLSWGVTILSLLSLSLLVALHLYLLRRVTPLQVAPPRRRVLSTLCMVLLLGVNFVGIRGGVDESTANPSYAYFSSNQYLNHAALNPLFNVVHSFSKQEKLSDEFRRFSDDEMASLTQGVYYHDSAICDTLLRTSRPDILLLIWEGGGSLMTGCDSIAPGFARLKEEGVFFSQCYANNFRTDRGLVSILNGWPALPTTSVMKMSGRCSKLPGLARTLASLGYSTTFRYGGDIDFTNMRGYLFETGFQQVLGGENYRWVPDQGKWGADDEYVLSLQYPLLPPSPFFLTVLTLSSHEPWQVPYHRLSSARQNAFAYTDSCVFHFVEQLRATPDWDNLLLVIVPDHGVSDRGLSLSDVEVSRIPILWLGGAVKGPAEVSCLMNQSDLAATLLAQMGVDASGFPFSRNVLSPACRPSVAMHGFKNGVNLIDSLGSTRFECVDGQLVPSVPIHRENADTLAAALLQLIYQTTGKL